MGDIEHMLHGSRAGRCLKLNAYDRYIFVLKALVKGEDGILRVRNVLLQTCMRMMQAFFGLPLFSFDHIQNSLVTMFHDF